MKKNALILAAITFTFLNPIRGQVPTQTLRGEVVEEGTGSTLPGVYVTIVDDKDSVLLYSTSDFNGRFAINKVPVGRVTLKSTSVGYKPEIKKNLLLLAGKSLFVRIEMRPDIETLGEVVVVAKVQKEEVINKMAPVSARVFSMEEAEKYAGSLGDPARMAQNFAGVSTGGGDNRNDLVIRGNSPLGMLWRLDGVDILNPNHFAAAGSNGGAVTMLNSNLLSNSDFMTGAFPAEYGNALAGVFDLKMRTGNPDKHEFTGQVGWNGLEVGAEGPLSKKSGATYMIFYRYSLLSTLYSIGLLGNSGSAIAPAIPHYQDLTLKLDIPLKKAGSLSLIAIGGKSEIGIDPSDNGFAAYDIQSGSDLLSTFLKHQIKLGKKGNLSTYVSLNGSRSFNVLDSARAVTSDRFLYYRSNNIDWVTSVGTRFKMRLSHNWLWESGATARFQTMNYVDSVYNETLLGRPYNAYTRITDERESTELYQGYTQTRFYLGRAVTFIGGLFGQYLTVNKTYALDPRAALKFRLSSKVDLSFGYGRHSQVQPLFIYFVKTWDYSGGVPKNPTYTNKDLDMTLSDQFVSSINYKINPNLRVKLEGYLQDVKKLPVHSYPSPFSLANFGANFQQDREDSLVNNGTQKNYGIELTIERFLYKNWYLLNTLSLFRSRYKGSDGVERSTRFETQYIWNILAGWEIPINSYHRLSFDIKSTFMGGTPYIPVVVRDGVSMPSNDPSTYLKERTPNYFKLDFRVAYKRNWARSKVSEEYGLDLQNITNRQNPWQPAYSPNGETRWIYQLGFFPMFTYRISF